LNSGVPINMPKINEEFCTILEGGWGVQKSLSRTEPNLAQFLSVFVN